jgi:putative ABC transport system permease protein
MNISEAMRIAWDAILKNKIRAFLTMLGIIIGVAAVIMMIAISTGTEATIQDQITSLGSNLLFVQSSFGRGGPGAGEGARQSTGLIYDDATAIQDQVSGVAAVVVEQNTSQTVKVGSTQLTGVSIDGSSPGLPTVRGLTIASGRYLNANDVTLKQKVAVLGYSLAQQLFGSTNPLGQYVQVGTTKLAVIGVLAEKGSVGGTDFDSVLYTPITVVFEKFIPSRFARILGNNVRMITVSANPNSNMDDIINQITLLLVKRHGLTVATADFAITTQSDIISTRESTTAAFRNLLAWVAGVSLIVGGIGIMNIMLVSVTERTREIGIRQSIGATPNDIRLQFLIEALLLSIVGGLIGVAVGVGGSYLFGTFSAMRTVISVSSIFLAFGSAALVGAFFGFYPANQAAKLDPIEALRYE